MLQYTETYTGMRWNEKCIYLSYAEQNGRENLPLDYIILRH